MHKEFKRRSAFRGSYGLRAAGDEPRAKHRTSSLEPKIDAG